MTDKYTAPEGFAISYVMVHCIECNQMMQSLSITQHNVERHPWRLNKNLGDDPIVLAQHFRDEQPARKIGKFKTSPKPALCGREHIHGQVCMLNDKHWEK